MNTAAGGNVLMAEGEGSKVIDPVFQANDSNRRSCRKFLFSSRNCAGVRHPIFTNKIPTVGPILFPPLFIFTEFRCLDQLPPGQVVSEVAVLGRDSPGLSRPRRSENRSD